MSRRMERPDTERILSSLKDFQRDTVEYATRRLWTDRDPVKRFLVADEVGLGKTMVAKGVIAKTVEHLWEIEDRIDIVYICSNTQIARQNIGRLNVVGGAELRHADRLTLLPQVIRELRAEKVNFVSFTPGTSFEVGNQGGKYQERVMLYWMLAEAWGREAVRPRRWTRFFQATMGEDRFAWHLSQFDRSTLDPALVVSFGFEVDTATGPEGGRLREELEACVADFNGLRNDPDSRLSARRNRLIGTLRNLVARAAVEHLEPDLVILDEFQRFKNVLDRDTDEADLARAVFDHEKARVLLLSATPFKMYTLPDEPEGDDHYEDFNRTVEFLAGVQNAAEVKHDLRTMRDTAMSGPPSDAALAAHHRVEQQLRRVMSRMERLASSPDRDGMLTERQLSGAKLDAQDVRTWATFDAVSRHLDRHDVFEYWRSTPYPLNLMERDSYQVRKKLDEAISREDPELARLLQDASGLLSWADIETFKEVDPGNAKLRGLVHDILDRGAWKLAWIPPSLPYYGLGAPYDTPGLRDFTKRLIFSAWAVVPKAVSVMLSVEAERRAVIDAGMTQRSYEQHRGITAPLQFRPAGTTMALLYPSHALAQAGDPLVILRESGDSIPMDRDKMIGIASDRVKALLAVLNVQTDPDAGSDSRWYWAAPALLDRARGFEGNAELRRRLLSLGDDEEDDSSRLGVHLQLLAELDTLEPGDDASALGLGAIPEDLAVVLTDLAIAGPGVVALRSLTRIAGDRDAVADVEMREQAFRVAQGLRSLFNKPEVIASLRTEGDDAYWRTVLHHGIDGCLQSVLDEYAHVLVESEGLQEAAGPDKVERIAEVMEEALSIRAAANVIDDINVVDGRVEPTPHRAGSHFAARYGRAQSSDNAVMREGTVRVAYNSPFRPFVLASTSVGQEGLDFHTYSHAIVHWNLPGNPVDLEQREGRVHRYKGHAVRKNVANSFGQAALDPSHADPWTAVFNAAVNARGDSDSEIVPFWVFAPEGGAKIERYVPALPLSKELQHYRRLKKTVVTYRLLLGQPRQEDLLETLGADVEWMRIDLAAPRR
ncbi:helicase-related protein [Demequina capsici]|uniref:Helicase-related protein n=1 Tax=Demequina capsici TaxID=3075620 RepID=A0AA96F422_9MICO|nr:helicase-related protein [Demequina sp. OYTSA14]WNM23527.1 helicase-related protein [Demequina sp. OYTSA14]